MVVAGERVEEGNNDASKEEVVGGNNDYVVASRKFTAVITYLNGNLNRVQELSCYEKIAAVD